MNTKGSRASTAELSRKSVEGSDAKGDPAEEERKEDQPEGEKNEGSDANLEQKSAEEEINTQGQDNQSQHESEKSGKISPMKTPLPVAETELDPEKDETVLEPPLISETNISVEAIPIDKQDLPKEELKDEEEKEKSDEKEQLSVELPPEKPEEEKEMSPPMEDNEPLRVGSGNQSPAPHIDTPRPASEIQESVEPPIEKTTITPAENQPGLDLELGTRTPSPDGKNDSAISSSSLSPEQERTESGMGERQGTPVIEVA